eukprot:3724282-Rhodomonas_salina.1
MASGFGATKLVRVLALALVLTASLVRATQSVQVAVLHSAGTDAALWYTGRSCASVCKACTSAPTASFPPTASLEAGGRSAWRSGSSSGPSRQHPPPSIRSCAHVLGNIWG